MFLFGAVGFSIALFSQKQCIHVEASERENRNSTRPLSAVLTRTHIQIRNTMVLKNKSIYNAVVPRYRDIYIYIYDAVVPRFRDIYIYIYM